ncbi:MAG: hypothetical protein QM758_23275 [Armatimonas sp.]
MRKLLLGVCALFCLSLVAGCTPKADTPPLEAETTQAKKMPGADTPPAAATDPNTAKKAKTGD